MTKVMTEILNIWDLVLKSFLLFLSIRGLWCGIKIESGKLSIELYGIKKHLKERKENDNGNT